MPEVVDREADKCDYLHQAREALHHLSTEMNEEIQLKRRFAESTPAYRQKQFDEGIKRITQLKGSFLHLTNEQQVKILVAMSSVPQVNAASPAPSPPAPSPPASSPPAPSPVTSPATPSALVIVNDSTGGDSTRDTICTTIADALADDDMWV